MFKRGEVKVQRVLGGETHSLVAGGKEGGHSLGQFHERRTLLRLTVPTPHHHLIPEHAQVQKHTGSLAQKLTNTGSLAQELLAENCR